LVPGGRVNYPYTFHLALLTEYRNMGKHAADLDLKSPKGRSKFEALLAEADVFVDGYRHGALERLGYGVSKVKEVARERGKGIVYVSENCFGYGIWAERPGWQQIADCVSGVAWEQGRFMNLNEPM
jgi:crotonobetainyl-CoA:carnitine CoA-transferase CaiB-like acyl-CoA transferase